MGYHTKKIDKGTLGEFSKIKEEFEEALDAHEQDNFVLILCEFADIIGAIEAYAEKRGVKLSDIIKMKIATRSAFESGERK